VKRSMVVAAILIGLTTFGPACGVSAPTLSGQVFLQGKPAYAGLSLYACVETCGSGWQGEPVDTVRGGRYDGLVAVPGKSELIGKPVTFHLEVPGFGQLQAAETDVYLSDTAYVSSARDLHFGGPREAMGVFVSDGLAYVADRRNGFRIIDVSDPFLPVEIGVIIPHGNPPHYDYRDVFVSGDLAYAAAGEGGLSIIDVSEPRAPAEIGSVPYGASNLFISGDFAFYSKTGGFGSDSFRIVDVSKLWAPVVVAKQELWKSQTQGIFVSGGLAFVALGGFVSKFTSPDWGLRILDVSNPLAPSQVGALGGEAWDVFVSGELAYVTDGDGVRVVDVSNPSAPVQVGQVRAVRSRYWPAFGAIFVSADLLFMSDGGLSIVDMSDPTAPVEVGHLESGGGNDIFVSGGIAYIAGGSSGLLIVDVSEPTAPVEMSRLLGP